MKLLALDRRHKRRRHRYHPQPELNSRDGSSGDREIYRNVHAKTEKEKDDVGWCVGAGRTYWVIGVVGKTVIVQVICVRKIGLSVISYSWPDSDRDTHRNCKTLHPCEVVAIGCDFAVVADVVGHYYRCAKKIGASCHPHRDLQSVVH